MIALAYAYIHYLSHVQTQCRSMNNYLDNVIYIRSDKHFVRRKQFKICFPSSLYNRKYLCTN